MKKGVIAILATVAGLAAGATGTSTRMGKKIAKNQELAERHFALFMLMNQWVKVKQEGKNIADYLIKNGYHSIAVYGMSYVGETLISELEQSEVKIICAIDRNADGIYSEVDIITPDDEIPEVDAVVVTAITFFDEIEEILGEKTSAVVLSIEDILYDI